MKRWLLTAALGIGLLVPAFSDDPKPPVNPFRDNTQNKAKPKEAEKAAEKPKDKSKEKDEATDTVRVAHIKLSGDMDEAPVAGESLFGAPAENFSLMLARIHKAADDSKVKALYLQIGDPQIGFGKLHELRAAIANFKKSGKKVFAYAEDLSAKGYLIALACDQIVLPPSGGIMLVGLRAEVTYYKSTLELMRLKVDVAKVGNYKSAVEPFLKDEMSPENREQIQAMIDDNFDNEIIKPMLAGRPAKKWSAKAAEDLINQGPFTANQAKTLGLIDAIAYEDEFEAMLGKQLANKTAKVDRNYGKPKAKKMDFSNPFALFDMIGGSKEKESDEPKIAVIYVIGSITSGKSGGGSGIPLMGGNSVGSETIVEAIRKAEADKTVKAIVLRIDSPGGSALASDIMWRELSICKKPVVASMGDVAASGGYYVAMPCKKIFAEPGTITGSIGVFGMKIVTHGLEEWGGMKTIVLQRGKNAGVMSSTFPWTDSEKKVVEASVEEIYEQFTSKALAGRKAAGKTMTKDELVALAGGRVWTGRQAKANGLVDELGTLDDAIAEAKKLAKIDPSEKMEILPLPKASSFFDKLMDGDGGFPFGSMELAVLKKLPGGPKATRMLHMLTSTQKDTIKMFVPFDVEFK